MASKKADPSPKAGTMAAGRDRRIILDYLRALRDNNTREWFEANRPRYEEARSVFLELVGELIDRFDPVDELGSVSVKECVFRINRDVRFSKDKTPYKTAMTALLGRGGRKSTGRTYYLHIESDGQSILAGGLWEPSSEELAKMRQALDRDPRPFRKILAAPDFATYFGELAGESLKTAPQGYPKDHPDIELLRMKQFMTIHRLSDKAVVSPELVPHCLTVFKAMKPFLSYIEKVLA